MAAKIVIFLDNKSKRSERFKTVKSFFEYHKFSHQNFMKVYHHYRQNPVSESLLPQKRGPKFKTGRFDLAIEEEIASLRQSGHNRYEIREILRREVCKVPRATTII